VLFAHPAVERSRVQRALAEAVRGLPGVTFHDLYEAYPDFDVDVRREQDLLVAHDQIVFQHPMYWYSAPAIVKQWLDLVLEHGWAFGARGTALKGKRLLCAISTGGGESSYQHEGFNRFTLAELFAPISQTAALCGMEYLPPFVVHGTHAMDAGAIAAAAGDYRRLLEALRDGVVALAAARTHETMNAVLHTAGAGR
jgi:glutathione-regulated potassium-efflux system ancillary protein KefG